MDQLVNVLLAIYKVHIYNTLDDSGWNKAGYGPNCPTPLSRVD